MKNYKKMWLMLQNSVAAAVNEESGDYEKPREVYIDILTNMARIQGEVLCNERDD